METTCASGAASKGNGDGTAEGACGGGGGGGGEVGGRLEESGVGIGGGSEGPEPGNAGGAVAGSGGGSELGGPFDLGGATGGGKAGLGSGESSGGGNAFGVTTLPFLSFPAFDLSDFSLLWPLVGGLCAGDGIAGGRALGGPPVGGIGGGGADGVPDDVALPDEAPLVDDVSSANNTPFSIRISFLGRDLKKDVSRLAIALFLDGVPDDVGAKVAAAVFPPAEVDVLAVSEEEMEELEGTNERRLDFLSFCSFCSFASFGSFTSFDSFASLVSFASFFLIFSNSLALDDDFSLVWPLLFLDLPSGVGGSDDDGEPVSIDDIMAEEMGGGNPGTIVTGNSGGSVDTPFPGEVEPRLRSATLDD